MQLLTDFELGIWNAWIFMIWLVISPFLSGFLIREREISNSLKASVPMKGEKTFNVISMLAVIFGFIFSIVIPLRLTSIWFFVGLIIFLFGFIINFSVLFALRKAIPGKPFTKGPYKYSRHPLYVALIMIIVGSSIMSISWILLVFLIIIIIHLILAIPAEEKYCLNKYGKEYLENMKRTPRWIGVPR